MAEQHSAATEDEAACQSDVQPGSHAGYQPPRMTLLGTLSELTGGPDTGMQTDGLMTGSM